jgi:Rrf2 family protein
LNPQRERRHEFFYHRFELPDPAGGSALNGWRMPIIENKMLSIKDDYNIILIVDIRIILIDYIGMLCLSQTTGYAVQALVCLDEQGGHASLIRDIARCAGIPKPYLARIINDLVHEGLVAAKRGYRGGIALARPARNISLLQIVEAIEGPNWIAPCLLGLNDCTAHTLCPAHVAWQRISRQLKALLGRTTLADVMVSPRRKQALRRNTSHLNPRLAPRRATA